MEARLPYSSAWSFQVPAVQWWGSSGWSYLGSVIWEKESGTPNPGSEVDVPRSATKIGGSSERQEGGIGR